MKPSEALALQTRLLKVFEIHGVNVGVGLTKDGVAIRSQDDRVDACNIGEVISLYNPDLVPQCPCGAVLETKADLEASDDAMDAYLASHMRDDDGYCFEEDDIVPLGYAAEIWRRRRNPNPVPLDFPF